jgi:hypothetical protein
MQCIQSLDSESPLGEHGGPSDPVGERFCMSTNYKYQNGVIGEGGISQPI